MAKLTVNEDNLHQWLRKVWPGPVQRHEPARGTTVGHPDVSLTVKFHLNIYMVPMPVHLELKVWSITESRIKVNVRPAQVRYHHWAAGEGHTTAILALLLNQLTGEKCAFLIPGTEVQSTCHKRAVIAGSWRSIGWEVNDVTRQQLAHGLDELLVNTIKRHNPSLRNF